MAGDGRGEQGRGIDLAEKDEYGRVADNAENFCRCYGEDEMDFRWKGKVQIRVGAEYLISDNFALRAGYYYDPTPTPDSTLNILLPSTTFNAIAGGIGYNANGIELDVTVEYLMGKNREVPFLNTVMDPEWESAMPGVYELDVLAIEFSVGYRW